MKIENIDDIKSGHWLTYNIYGDRFVLQIVELNNLNGGGLTFKCKEETGDITQFDNIFDDGFDDEVYETQEEIKEKYVEDFI